MSSPATVTVTAIVTAFQRVEPTLVTLESIRQCRPCPKEIIVHVDFGGEACGAAIARTFTDVKILSSDSPVGPGGGRNKLIAAASNELVASFDDDSYPLDRNYFARLQELFANYPQASVIAADVFTRSNPIRLPKEQVVQVATFVGAACAYRRSVFMKLQGYVPLTIAYGMEEVDLALQLHDARQVILKSSRLRVFHDTDYCGHARPEVVAGTIANAALLPYLRYPASGWPRGMLQILNACVYAIKHGRRRGIVTGLLRIPRHLLAHRRYRQVVTADVLRSYLALRSRPRPVVPSHTVPSTTTSAAGSLETIGA